MLVTGERLARIRALYKKAYASRYRDFHPIDDGTVLMTDGGGGFNVCENVGDPDQTALIAELLNFAEELSNT